MEPLTLGCDALVRVTGFKNQLTGAFLNAATVKTWTLTDLRDGSDVDDGELAYEAASDGDYSAVIESTAFEDLPVDCPYRVTVNLREGTVDLERVHEGFVRRAGAS